MQKRNDKKNTGKMDMPFLEKFMVPLVCCTVHI